MTSKDASLSAPVTRNSMTHALPRLALPKLNWLLLACLAAVYLIWSSTYLALRFMVNGLPPLATSGVRFMLAGGLLYAFVRLRGSAAPTPRQWLLSSVSGTLLFLVGNGFVALAASQVPSGVMAMSVASMPLFLTAMEAALGKRPPLRQWLGLGCGFLGVGFMSFSDMQAPASVVLLLLLAPLGWAAGSLAVRRFDLPAGVMASATQMLAAGAIMLLIGLLRGERFGAMPEASALAAFGYLVVFGSIVAFSACLHLLRTTSAPLATSYAYVNPVLAVALGALVAGERLPAKLLGAGLLVVVGVAVLLTSAAPKARA